VAFVVSAEGVYGDVAQQIAGPLIGVTSILKDPNTDPHLYESSVNDARAVASAQLVIENGAGYDAWMDHLLSASPRPTRLLLNAGELVGVRPGDNPHIWYSPAYMRLMAAAIEKDLERVLPSHLQDLRSGLDSFLASTGALRHECSQVADKYAGAFVLPTEPVANYLLEACGLRAQRGPFQLAVQEGNDPPAASVEEFQQALVTRQARALVYNTQAVSPITQNMRTLAQQQGVPVVGVSETLPSSRHYQDWMLDDLKAVAAALGG
jgi:zinc/manganese transport system substrate-binding protein